MPNTPSQFPQFDLPGAEYFSLAPNASILFQNRQSAIQSQAAVSVPAGSISTGGSVSIQLSANWGYGDGLWLVRGLGSVFASDNSGELQIIQARLGLGQANLGIFLDVGIPTATLSTLINATAVAIYERDALITIFDFQNRWPIGSPLFLDLQISVKNNDATNPHSFTPTLSAVWHLLKGFTQ